MFMYLMIIKAPSTSIDGFHSDVIKLLSQNSKVVRILIFTRLNLNKK